MLCIVICVVSYMYSYVRFNPFYNIVPPYPSYNHMVQHEFHNHSDEEMVLNALFFHSFQVILHRANQGQVMGRL